MAESDEPPGRVRRALLAAHDTAPFVPLARGLRDLGVELFATAGTRRRLGEAGLAAHGTDEITGLESWFGGRVKTLHPKLMGGILAPRDGPGTAEMGQRGILPFDLVAVGLYPFEEALRSGAPESQLIEQIDIGGVTLLRGAAKNFRFVVPVSDPRDIPALLEELRQGRGCVGGATRRRLAETAFRRTALYDAAILGWLARGGSSGSLPAPPSLVFTALPETLRYGENPHQRSMVYARTAPPGFPLDPWPLEVLKGEALSYNNLLDLDAALLLVGEFPETAAVVVKHATPCGVATGGDVSRAVLQALDCDPVARFGCVIALNRPCDERTVDELKGTFVDVLVGPEFPPAVRERLSRRAKLKLVAGAPPSPAADRWEARTAAGRLLAQEGDRRVLRREELRQVSRRGAAPELFPTMEFAWRVVRHVKSNAVVLAQGAATVGIGAGQTSRVGAVRNALEVAGPRAAGAVLASDAYFPFPDGVEEAGRAGVAVVVQPGGSIRDAEVIAAADRLGIAMYCTGWRAFRH